MTEEIQGPKEVDFECIPAASILDQLDEEFYTLLESSKWQERKDQLSRLEELLDVDRLENGSYFELARILEKVSTLSLRSNSHLSKSMIRIFVYPSRPLSALGFLRVG